MSVARQRQREAWVSHHFSASPWRIEPASADASFRSYWRVHADGSSYILMDAPPDKEDSAPFVDIDRRLRRAGLHAPEIFAADLDQGFLLLEDLGDRLYADDLDAATADTLYAQAMDALARMQSIDTAALPCYDRDRLEAELALFPDWYLSRQLAAPPGPRFRRWWTQLVDLLVANAEDQPQVFVHRDYHCANLMRCDDPPGILDFQDAVRGPVTYDLASLLMDRYVTWPDDRLYRWCDRFRQARAPQVGADQWRRWFDLMGLQRNLKVVGIFARLKLRDGKPRYLAWQPRFVGYLRAVAGRYPKCAELSRCLERVDA